MLHEFRHARANGWTTKPTATAGAASPLDGAETSGPMGWSFMSLIVERWGLLRPGSRCSCKLPSLYWGE